MDTLALALALALAPKAPAFQPATVAFTTPTERTTNLKAEAVAFLETREMVSPKTPDLQHISE